MTKSASYGHTSVAFEMHEPLLTFEHHIFTAIESPSIVVDKSNYLTHYQGLRVMREEIMLEFAPKKLRGIGGEDERCAKLTKTNGFNTGIVISNNLLKSKRVDSIHLTPCEICNSPRSK